MAKRKAVMPDMRQVDHPEAAAIAQHINENPHEVTPRLVYSDWLDENGYGEHAEGMRSDAHGMKNPRTAELVRLSGISPHPTPINSIELRARRWRDRMYGITHHTVDILVDGNHVHTIPNAHAYAHQAKSWLQKSGYIPEHLKYIEYRDDENGYQAVIDRGAEFGNPIVNYIQSVQDVRRKKDL